MALSSEERARRNRACSARWRAANKEKIKERMAAWRQENKEKVAATARRYFEAHKEEIRERNRANKRVYDAAHREEKNARERDRRARAKDARDVVRLAAAMDTLATLMRLARDAGE